MCDTCGCNDHIHPHDHSHGHEGKPHIHRIDIQTSAVAYNQRFADQNRGWFKAKGMTAYNVLSSPGSGKTAFLEACLRFLNQECRPSQTAVAIVGDLQTDNDAERLRATGAEALQITTGATCHLDAHMVAHALDELKTENIQHVFIENVGNLVCPATYDLGEAFRWVLLSVTEGEDKPLKYPVIFQKADFVLITKMDLAEAVEFKRDVAIGNIRAVAPNAEVFEVSVKEPHRLKEFFERLTSLRA